MSNKNSLKSIKGTIRVNQGVQENHLTSPPVTKFYQTHAKWT